MSTLSTIDTDPLAVRPIIEALIFASEEPLSARMLIRLLAGEKARSGDRIPPLLRMMEVSAKAESAADNGASSAVEEVDVEEPDVDTSNLDEVAQQDADDLADAIERAELRTSGNVLEASDADLIDQRYVRRLIDQLNIEYEETNRAFRIVEFAGGFQFATMREYGEYVALLSKERGRRRLSPAALESLAIIAYRQPVSKPEIEAIRGVNCDQVLVNLMEKNLVTITGRADSVGRPLLYGTTKDFLRSFGLNNVTDLPKLREIEELMETDAFSATRAEIVMIDHETNVEEIEARVGAMGHLHRDEELSEGKELLDVVRLLEGEESLDVVGFPEGDVAPIVDEREADQQPDADDSDTLQ